MVKITDDVIAALERILDVDDCAYKGLALAGSREAAQHFHDDVMLVATTLAEVISALHRPKERVM